VSLSDLSIVLVHGARADGSSWSKIIRKLAADGVAASAAPPPLTSFPDGAAALERAPERVPGTVVLAGHAPAPELAPDDHGLIYVPTRPSAPPLPRTL
jgi:hypothetical protein